MNPLDPHRYQEYLVKYIQEAIAYSDGTNRGIALHLSEITIKKWTSHRKEKERALSDAREAFSTHIHWPREIILSYLGIKQTE